MNSSQIQAALVTGSFSTTEIQAIIQAVNYASKRVREAAKASFRVGDAVKWTNTRSGIQMTGRVVKISVKNIRVETPTGMWIVGATLLQKA